MEWTNQTRLYYYYIQMQSRLTLFIFPRADQCEVWNHFFEHEGEKHHWLPIEHPDPDERCRLFCQSNETSAVVSMNRMVHDGTLCSYSDPYSVCVRGECEQVGCDGQIASDKQEDRCGVCGGDNSSCKIVKGNFTRSTKKSGYLKILEIPKGARHLLVQEFKGTPHVLALKNLETGHLFLNDEEDSTESHVVIEKGVAWEYTNSEEDEHIQTTGPLKYGVLLMIRSHADTKVTVSYKYIIQEGLQIHKENDPMVKDSMFYEWALKRWSQCSKPCGGGKQYTRFGCRRKADGKMVHRMFCSDIHKPRAISRSCNTDTCSSPRWVSGEWEDCSASCGQTGWQRRWVSCQQASSKGQLRSVNSKLCGDGRPDTKQPCNRNPCPATWRAGPWTPCTVSCGNGTQERQVACSSPEGAEGNCSLPSPITSRICRVPPCGGDQRNITPWLSRSNVDFPMPKISFSQRCRGDRSVFCRMESLSRYCRIPGYRQMCCKSCGNFSISDPPTGNSSSWTLTTETVTLASNFTTIISDIISTLSSGFSEAPHKTTTTATTAPPTTATTAPPTTTTTAPPTTTTTTTTRDSTDFVYVDYDDYNEYSFYEEPAEMATTVSPYIPSTVTAPTMPPQKTDPPSFLRENNTSSLDTVPMATTDHQRPTQTPVRISAVPEFPTTVMMADDIITNASPSGATSGERGVKVKTNQNKTEPPPVLFVPSSKKENNSVDEVPYRIVGLDSDIPRGQQNYFVPRMPRFRERTQNKRIQELLNEKRRQDLLKRAGRNSRTEQKRSGL